MHRTLPPHILAVGQAGTRVQCALRELSLKHTFINPDIVLVQLDESRSFQLYISPNDLQYFRRKHGRKALSSSQHSVIRVYASTTVAQIKAIVANYIEKLDRGKESEDIALEALKLAMRQRSDLFADGYKTGAVADIAGSDLRVGLFLPTHKIWWIGFQIKSSVEAQRRTIEKWRIERQNGQYAENENRHYLRRVIPVPRDGTREERISIMARRMIEQAETLIKGRTENL